MAPRRRCFSRSVIGLLPLLAVTVVAASPVTVPSEACSAEEPPNHIPWVPTANETRTFNIGGRDVHIFVPDQYSHTEPQPLIFAFHDKNQNVQEFMRVTQLNDNRVNNRAVVIYPTASKGTWKSDIRPLKHGQKPDEIEKDGTDDIEYVSGLLEDLQRAVCIDLTNVHATGLGSGGGMTHLLACDKAVSTRFASFAPVGGGYGRDDDPQSNGTWAKCEPGRQPVPMLEIHGSDDLIMPYTLKDWENGKKRLHVRRWLEDWSERNGCGDEGDEESISTTEKRTTYIRMTAGGVMSRGDKYGTNIIRTARACPATVNEKGEAIKKPKALALQEPADEQISVLHYKLPETGHAWPRQQYKRVPDLQSEEESEALAESEAIKVDAETGAATKFTTKLFFDATVVVLDWFRTHPLPVYLAEEWKKKDEDAIKARENFQKTMRQNENVRQKENAKLLEHISKRVAEGQMTEEQADVYRAKIRQPVKEHEYAGFGPDDDEDEDEELGEVVIDEKDLEARLEELKNEGESDEEETETKGHDEL